MGFVPEQLELSSLLGEEVKGLYDAKEFKIAAISESLCRFLGLEPALVLSRPREG